MNRCYFWRHRWSRWSEPKLVVRKREDGVLLSYWRQESKCGHCGLVEFHIVENSQ